MQKIFTAKQTAQFLKNIEELRSRLKDSDEPKINRKDDLSKSQIR